MKRFTRISVVLACAALAAAFLTTRLGAESEELSVCSGPLRLITVPLEGPTADVVYFEITPVEAGAPSSFKIKAANMAAVQLLAAAVRAPMIRVTYREDFTVTELEVLGAASQ